ncbi:MAG: S-layer homology domain-containing protein [Oscillospiraceae bacterium]|jgi:hypothetical protein|nr:S-layer homology domain-containing protein [Oscillospiraceae bacterium]
MKRTVTALLLTIALLSPALAEGEEVVIAPPPSPGPVITVEAHYADWDTIPEWAKQGVTFALESGLMGGVPGGRFDSYGTVTNAQLATVLAATSLSLDPAEYPGFTDVAETAWFAPFIRAVCERGLMGGADGLFSPDAKVTHEQLAAVLARALGLTLTGGPIPADLADADAQYSDAISAVFAEGIMSGDGTLFRPKAEVTRAELAVIMAGIYL